MPRLYGGGLTFSGATETPTGKGKDRSRSGLRQADEQVWASANPRRDARGVEGHAVREDELWKRSLAGDGEAFGVLFDRHGGLVFRPACRLVATRRNTQHVHPRGRPPNTPMMATAPPRSPVTR